MFGAELGAAPPGKDKRLLERGESTGEVWLSIRQEIVGRIKILLRRHGRENMCVKTPEGTMEQRWEGWAVLLSCEEAAPLPRPRRFHADASSAGSCWGRAAGK